MAKRIDWDGLFRIYLERNRQDGPEYSLRQLAKDEARSYTTLAKHAKANQWHDRMVADCRAFQERVAAEVAERSFLDQVEERLRLLAPGRLAAELLTEELELFMERRRRLKDARRAMEPRDLRAIAQIAKDLIEMGAGLPKEHKVAVDEVHDEIKMSRQTMKDLERTARNLAEWKRRRRGKGGGSKKKS